MLDRQVALTALVLLAVGCTTAAIATPSPEASTSPPSQASGPTVAATSPSPATIAPSASAAQPTSETTEPPTTTPLPAPTDTPPPQATPSPTGSAEGLTIDWQQVGGDVGLGIVYEWRLSAAANGRFVAYGFNGDTEDFAMWTSGDGRRWEPSDLGQSGSLSLRDVTGGGPGFVGVGSEPFDQGVALLSSDGRSWEHIADADLSGWNLSHVRSTGEALVAFAFDSERQAGRIFVSGDGRDWEPVESETASAIAEELLDLETWDGRIVAFTAEAFESAGCRRPVIVWETTDGVDWTVTGELPRSRSVGCSSALNIAAGDNGWVVAGSVHQGGNRAWHSVDGRTWQEALNAPANITDIFADPSGYIAVGHFYPGGGCAIDESSAVGQTWTSADGLRWIKQPEAGWEHLEIDLLRRSGRDLIGIGIDWTTEQGIGAIWTADLPSIAGPAGPDPSPTPTPVPNEGCGGD